MRESKRELKVKVHLNVDEKEKTRGRAWDRWQRRGRGGRGQTGIDSNCAEVFTFKKDLINTILVKQLEEEYLCEKIAIIMRVRSMRKMPTKELRLSLIHVLPTELIFVATVAEIVSWRRCKFGHLLRKFTRKQDLYKC